MDLGIIIGDTRTSVSPADHLDQLLRQVEAAQRNGLRLITIGQHFLYGDLRWLQPVPTLARLAAEVDDDVRLATNIILVPLYHPVLLAEELATLDIVTNGRLIVGVGLGYRTEEFDALGIPFDERVSRLEEGLEVIGRLWTEDEVDHHGRHWTLTGVRPHLRPVQTPRPEVWLGAQSTAGVRRAARLADRWTISPREPIGRLAELWEVYRSERLHLRESAPAPVLRRDLVLGGNRTEALSRFEAMAKGRYVAYAERELAALDPAGLEKDFSEAVAGTVLAGTASEVVDQISVMQATVPFETLLVRPQWPDMSAADVVQYLDDLGRELVPSLQELDSGGPR